MMEESVMDPVHSQSKVNPNTTGEQQHRGNTLFCCAVNLDFESAVTAKDDEFKAVLIARIHAR